MNMVSFIRNIAILTVGGFLLLTPCVLRAQSTCIPTVTVTPVKCSGGNDGSLTVTTTTCSTDEGCFTGTPPNIPQCTGCTRTVTGGQVTINAGEVVCLQNNFNGGLAFNGGEVRICGTATIGSINFATSNNTATLSISPSATATVGNISINSAKAVVNNYGKLTVNNNYPVVGIFRNYGTAIIKGLNTNGNPSIAELHNFAMLTINGNAVNGKVFENRGTMTINGDFMVNAPASNNVNKCTINVNGNMLLDNSNTLDDRGSITITETFTMNSNVTLKLQGNTKVTTKNFNGNAGATIKSTSMDCGLISTSATTIFNGNFTVNGKISYCDKNNIETDNGAMFINGATKDINGACRCTPSSTPPPGIIPTFTWSGNGVSGSGSTLSNLEAGTYTLTVTCGTCTSTTNWTVPQPTAITATAVVNSDKSVTLMISGGTPFPSPQPSYTFAWRHQGSDVVISTEQNPNNLPGGVNIVTVTDQNGCPGTTSVTIPLPACSPNIVVSQITCAGANNGKITIVDAGCSNPQINWVELGSSSSEISGLRPGTYTLNMTCSSCTYNQVFTLTEPPALTASATSDAYGQVTSVVGGGTPFPAPEPSYQYEWVYLNDPTIPKKVISNDPNPIGLPAGLNRVTVTDANGCTTTADVDVPDSSEQCVAPSTVTNVTCFGYNNGSIVFKRPDCPSAQIVWDGMPDKINQWELKRLAAGMYTVHISCESCFYNTSVEVTSPALLSIQADALPDGSGSSVVVGGTGPYFYQWMLEGGSIESRDANPKNLPPGNYVVTVTDANGCQDTDDVTVPDPDCIDDGALPTLNYKNESCPGASDGFIEFTLPCTNGSIEAIYTWNGPQVFNKTGSRLEDLVAGEYRVTIQCGKCTRERKVVVGNESAVTITPVQVGDLDCKQDFNAFITTTVTGGSGNYNYVWTDGFKVVDTSSSSLFHIVAGDYSLTATDQANSKCVAVKDFSIELPKEDCECEGGIRVKIDGDTPKCSGRSDGHLTAITTGGVEPYSYEWNTTAVTKDIDNVGPGWYTVRVTDSQGLSCFGRAYVPPPPEFSIAIVPSNGKSKVCTEADEQIELRAVVNAFASLVWNDGSTNSSLLITAPDTYTVTGTTANGCTKSASITVARNQDADPDCVCKSSVSLQPSDATCYGFSDGSVSSAVTGGGSGDYKYTWNTGSVDKDLTGIPAGPYSVSVTDVQKKCVMPLKEAVVKQPDALQVTITGDLFICGNSTILNATGSTGIYRWTGRTETTPSITVTKPGTYQVEVRDGTCSALSLPVQVEKQPDAVSVFGNQNKICPGDSLLLTSSFVTNNVWSTGAKTRSILVFEPGTYTVTVKLGSCVGSKGDFPVAMRDPKECVKPSICEPQFAKPIEVIDECKQFALDLARYNAQVKFTHYLEDQKQNFQKGYIAQCLKAQEDFTVAYKEKEYQYTLYYYDQSGSLVRTVPPQGVKIIEDAAILQQVKHDRLANARSVETEHDYLTTYSYNSYNALLTSKLPDQGTQQDDKVSNRSWYDELGRVVLSQTAFQFQQSPPRYSYSLYDPLNRIVEGGEVRSGMDMDSLVNPDNPTQIFSSKLTDWLQPETKYEVSRTYFDQAPFTIPNFSQDNLRNRIASVTYEVADLDHDSTTYDYATHYSYDIHGHAKKLVQDNPSLGHLPGQRFKFVEYIYDLISQNVLELHYQKGNADQFFHRNIYDADNRLVEVWTSSDYIHWDRDVKQFYYQHGPLARTELGHEKVQGVDYAYTIQGWIKGVNSNTLTPNRDMGKDGSNASLNKFIPQDEMGYSLGYFTDDYQAIGAMSANDNFLINQKGGELENVNKNLFNGNISNMITGIRQFMKDGEGPLAQSFIYDQLHRLKISKNYQDNNSMTGNTWSGMGTATDKYMMKLTYDANGNIITLKRNAHTSTTAEGDGLDDLIYYYENKANGYDKNTNKLISVQDNRNHTGDKELDKIDDIRPGQSKK